MAPPAAAEWTSLLRPLRGREPEGMWNLLSIVREMFKRNDRNAVPLLEIITEECLACEQILIWWFNTKLALLSGISGYGGNDKMNLFSFTNNHRMLTPISISPNSQGCYVNYKLHNENYTGSLIKACILHS